MVMRAGSLTFAFSVGAILAGLAMAGSVPARAQGVTTAAPAVAACLCAQRAVSITGREMRRSERRDREAHANLDAFSRQIEEARGRVNTDVRSDIEAFKAMLARRDQMLVSVRREDELNAAAVARYNEAVERNNAACSGRLFDPEEVDAVKANLVCPRP
jgi:hypothetical protein